MLIAVENVLTREEVVAARTALEAAAWVDGRETAGEQAAKVKANLQIPKDAPVAKELGQTILSALGRNPVFNSAVLPLRVLPPMFNRYDAGMTFGGHVDGTIQHVEGAGIRLRTDVSTTLFLSDPEDYDGGELIIEDTYGSQNVKLPAGSMILYPATSLHMVTPITRGSRWASFFWSQSIVRDDGQRRLLYELDCAIMQTRQQLSDDSRAVVGLTSVYHNLLRQWAEM